MRTIVWVIVLLMLSSQAICQRLIEGTIVDAHSKKPVPFTSIGLVGSSKGTSSNLNGQFSLSVPEHFKLQISCIGYESLTLDSLPDGGIILLAPRTTQLDPILVSSRPISPKKILRNALNRIPGNFNNNPFLQTFFYRHYCKDGDVYGRLIEAYVDLWRTKGYSVAQPSAQSDQIRISQLRRSLDNTSVAQGHEPIAIGSILETDLVAYQSKDEQLSFFTNISNLRAHLDDYSLSFEGITYYEGHEVYKIDYRYKRDSVLLSSGNYRSLTYAEGSIFITTDKYAIIKTEQSREFEGQTIKTSVYYRRYGQRYYPYHFSLDGLNNHPGADNHAYHIELISVDINTDPSAEFTGKVPGREELLLIPYDSAFWKASTILKTTPLEDEIILDLGGGQSLNRQFYRYQQYHLSTRDGGTRGVDKFRWLMQDSKDNRALYVMVWSENFKPYWFDLEYAKQLHKQFRNEITFVLISLDDNQERWQSTVQKYNLFADGMINYRVGANSDLSSIFQTNEVPAYMLIDRQGVIRTISRPSDPLLKKDLESIARKN